MSIPSVGRTAPWSVFLARARQALNASFFPLQIVLGLVLCGTQFVRILSSVEGQSLSAYLAMALYFLFQLLLAIAAHRTRPSAADRHVIWIYACWLLLVNSHFLAFALNGSYRWSGNDSLTTALAGGGTVLVFTLAGLQGVPLNDPMPKGLLGILLKAVPQFLMAAKIAQEGGGGLPGSAVLAGNLSILGRLDQIIVGIRAAGWERNRSWMLAGEIGNLLSWLTVSVVWLVWRFS
ncbi:MAG: hypothetical protein HY369_01370 [Candidatus Aenigmarchaeota archaeon]|nr:hypothetical protein [Candidatus Aenigmarchaeota archaeon]